MSRPGLEEPTIPARLRRPLAAVWLSIGVHAALIALIQVAPPNSRGVAPAVIEARLVDARTPQPGPAQPEAAPAQPPTRLAEARRSDARRAEPPRAEPPRAGPPSSEAVPVRALPETKVAPLAETRQGKLPDPAPASAQPAPDAPADPAPAPAAKEATEARRPVAPLEVTSAVDLSYYSARELDVQPRALREIVPDYPPLADRRRISGTVRLQIELEADGRVRDVSVVSANPPGVFEDSAQAAFREARFAPAQRKGRPVRARVLIEVVYDWEGRN